MGLKRGSTKIPYKKALLLRKYMLFICTCLLSSVFGMEFTIPESLLPATITLMPANNSVASLENLQTSIIPIEEQQPVLVAMDLLCKIIPKWTCVVCQNCTSFDNKAQLINHLQKDHSALRCAPLQCWVCKKEYNKLISYNQHIIQCLRKTEFCPLCKIKFVTWGAFRNHLLEVHFHDYAIGCICGKYFASESRLSGHRLLYKHKADQHRRK